MRKSLKSKRTRIALNYSIKVWKWAIFILKAIRCVALVVKQGVNQGTVTCHRFKTTLIRHNWGNEPDRNGRWRRGPWRCPTWGGRWGRRLPKDELVECLRDFPTSWKHFSSSVMIFCGPQIGWKKEAYKFQLHWTTGQICLQILVICVVKGAKRVLRVTVFVI